MPEYKNPKPCVDCGKPTTYRNKKGRCAYCAQEARMDSAEQIVTKEGPYYDNWKEKMIAAVKRREDE